MKKISLKSILSLSGITRRWLLNVLAVVVLVMLVCEIVFIVAFTSSTYSSVVDSATSYAKPFGALALATDEDFTVRAREISDNFADRDKVEVQVFDKNGSMTVTTGGFYGSTKGEELPDYKQAKESKYGTAYCRTKTEDGAPVLAATVILPDYGSGSMGAYRVLTSLDRVRIYMTVVISVAVFVGVVVVLITVFSGAYFIRSYVRPVHLVTTAAGNIAAGNFNDRLPVEHDDEIGELCRAINNMAEKLENTDKMKNDFISSVSHELRTPLTAIRGWGETVKMCVGDDPATVERGIDIILSEASRLSGLVEDILDFSRMQSGKLSVTLEKINAVAVLSEAVGMYTELAAKQKITLTHIAPENPPFVMADRNRLKQVYINVIDNAIKYSFEGGFVCVSSSVEDGCLRTEISDTGAGIAPKDIDRVKEKFYKANKTVPGSGIGLAVADEIIKQHNGLMFLESTEGVGTKVTIVLPVLPEEKQEDEVTAVYFPPMSEEETIDDVKQANSLEEIESELTGERSEQNGE